MLLIHPPLAKPSEPPAGIARLAGALRAHGHPCTVFDANLEGLLFLLHSPLLARDTWTRRARRGLDANLAALRNPRTYQEPDRYRRAVADVGRVLAMAGKERGVTLDLADYHAPPLSPTRSADLLLSAERHAENPFYPFFAERLSALIEENSPALVGLSLNYLSQALCAFAMAGFLKQRFSALPLVLGGGLVTSWMRNPAWRNPFTGLIDHLVAGPGEQALLDLLDGKRGDGSKDEGGTPLPFPAGEGRDDGIRCTNTREAPPCPPDYGGLPRADYLAPGFILPYAAASGCWWNRCSFCPERAEGNPYRQLPVARVLDEVADLVAETRPVLLHLLDNAVSPALLDGLTRQPPGVPWYGFARVTPHLADEEFCGLLAGSGCVMLKLGLESGDQNILDALDKGIDLTLVEKTLAALKAAGIATYVYLLFGTPAEDQASARRTLDFVARHNQEVGNLNLAIFNMPVGSMEAGRYATSGLYEGDLSLYTDFIHPGGWGRREVRRFLDREFRRHPAIAAILRRDPPQFTSNHAAFFKKSY